MLTKRVKKKKINKNKVKKKKKIKGTRAVRKSSVKLKAWREGGLGARRFIKY